MRIDWLPELLGFGSTSEEILQSDKDAKQASSDQGPTLSEPATTISISEADLRSLGRRYPPVRYRTTIRSDGPVDSDRCRAAGCVLAE